MKKKLLTTAALALLGAALLPAAKASPITYQTGDIILGFETTGGNSSGGTVNLLIDLGQFSNLNNFSSFNIAGDLNTVFGSNSWSSGQISFGALGVTLSGSHWGNVYETAASGTSLAALNSGNTSLKVDYSGLTGSTGIGYQSLSLTNNSSDWTGYGVEQTSSSATGSWGSYWPGGAGTGAFGISGQNIEGTIGSALGLYSVAYAAGANAFVNSGYTIGVDALGNINVAAVPEPSTYALLGLGLLLFVITYRRRSATTK